MQAAQRSAAQKVNTESQLCEVLYLSIYATRPHCLATGAHTKNTGAHTKKKFRLKHERPPIPRGPFSVELVGPSSFHSRARGGT